jgi:N6-adenosine-specific RNA methylase IME4
MAYRVIYADPPWKFRVRSRKGLSRSAENHYPTMTVRDIALMPVARLAEKGCALFLWVPMPQLMEGIAVMNAWGFEYKTVAFTWAKQTKRARAWHMGLGYWTRANCELCLLGTRGHPKRSGRGVRQLVVAPVGTGPAAPQTS